MKDGLLWSDERLFLECACDLPLGGGEFHLLQSVCKECGRCGLHPRQMGGHSKSRLELLRWLRPWAGVRAPGSHCQLSGCDS